MFSPAVSDGRRKGLSFQPFNEEAEDAKKRNRDYLASKYGGAEGEEGFVAAATPAPTPMPPQEQQATSRSPRNSEQLAQQSSSSSTAKVAYANPDDRPLPRPRQIFKDTAIDYQLPDDSAYGYDNSGYPNPSPGGGPSDQTYRHDDYYLDNYDQYISPPGRASEAGGYRPPAQEEDGDGYFAPRKELSPLSAIKAQAQQRQLPQRQAQAQPKAAASKQYSSGPLSTKAVGPLRQQPRANPSPNPNPPRRPVAVRTPQRGRRARAGNASIEEELRRYQAENESDAVEELRRVVASWKVRFFVELVRRKLREAKIRQAQFMILGREIDKLSSSRQLEGANRDQYFQQDVVELKESMEYWKRKAAEQADLLEAALRQRAATDAQHAAGARQAEQLQRELAAAQEKCHELTSKSTSLEASRALHEKEGDVIKQICAEYDRKLEDARMVAAGLKQTIVDTELRDRAAQREAQLLHEGELELRSGLVSGLNETVAQLSQEKSKLHADLLQAVEAGELLRQQLEQVRAANAKLQNDHGVFEQLITDLSVRAKDSEKHRLAQHIRVSELAIRNENQAAKIDSLQGSEKALTERAARLQERCAAAEREQERAAMVSEDCQEWIRIRTQTILNTSGYCRFIEEQLFNARREVLRHEELARNVLESLPPPTEGAGHRSLLPVGFEDMFDTLEPPDKVHTPVPHSRVEQLEDRLAALIEGLEGRLSQAVMEATPAKEALLAALERQVQLAVKESMCAYSAEAEASSAPRRKPEDAQQQLASMVAGLEARIDGLVAGAAHRISVLSEAVQQQQQQQPSPGVQSSESHASPADAAEDARQRSQKRSALKTMTQTRHAIEQELGRAEELCEELDFLVSRKAEVRAALRRWADDFTALCGRGPDASDRAKSHRYAELIASYKDLHTEVQQKHGSLRLLADSVEAQKLQLQASMRVVEDITGVKQPPHSYGVLIKESHRQSALAVDPLLEEEKEEAEEQAAPSTPSRAAAAPRRQLQAPRGAATPQAAKVPIGAKRAPESRVKERVAAAPSSAATKKERPPAAAAVLAAVPEAAELSPPATPPATCDPNPNPKELLASIAQAQEALELTSARKAAAALCLKQWGAEFKGASGRDPRKDDLDQGLVEPYNAARREEGRLEQELAALYAAYEQAAKEALFA